MIFLQMLFRSRPVPLIAASTIDALSGTAGVAGCAKAHDFDIHCPE
jgi:hypothetical protein